MYPVDTTPARPLLCGSWEPDAHGELLYTVGARCPEGCHRLQRRLDPYVLDNDWGVFAVVEAQLRAAFQQVHP